MNKREIDKYPKLVQHLSTVLSAYGPTSSSSTRCRSWPGDLQGGHQDALLEPGPFCSHESGPRRDGEFVKGIKSNIIFISTAVVTEFVEGKGMRRTPKDLVERVTITCCTADHWADDQDGRIKIPQPRRVAVREIVWGNSAGTGRALGSKQSRSADRLGQLSWR
jgi:hypothetical protein